MARLTAEEREFIKTTFVDIKNTLTQDVPPLTDLEAVRIYIQKMDAVDNIIAKLDTVKKSTQTDNTNAA